MATGTLAYAFGGFSAELNEFPKFYTSIKTIKKRLI